LAGQAFYRPTIRGRSGLRWNLPRGYSLTRTNLSSTQRQSSYRSEDRTETGVILLTKNACIPDDCRQ